MELACSKKWLVTLRTSKIAQWRLHCDYCSRKAYEQNNHNQPY